jgi:hypothetical protein
MGRLRQDRYIDNTTFGQLTMSVEPGKTVGIIYLDLIRHFLRESVASAFQPIGKGVSHRREPRAGVDRQRAGDCTTTAPTAADQADLKGVASRGMGGPRQSQSSRHCGSCHGARCD